MSSTTPDPSPRSAYIVGLAQGWTHSPSIAAYLAKIDSTLEAHGGRFLVHSADADVVEGDSPGAIVVVEFPSLDAAQAWYTSSSYRSIRPLRTENSESMVLIVQGVASGHRAIDLWSVHVDGGNDPLGEATNQ